jgi:hypothetical protein
MRNNFKRDGNIEDEIYNRRNNFHPTAISLNYYQL